MREVEIFPLWWKIVRLQQIAQKKIIPKSHELEHSAEVEIFSLLVENFTLSRKLFLGI